MEGAYRDLEHKLVSILCRFEGIENGWQALLGVEFDIDNCLGVS